jgi:hypothetical protein
MRGFDSIEAWHADIKQYDVRLEVSRQRERLLAVRCFTDDVVFAEVLKDLSQSVARRFFVVNDKYFHATFSSSGKRSLTV